MKEDRVGVMGPNLHLSKYWETRWLYRCPWPGPSVHPSTSSGSLKCSRVRSLQFVSHPLKERLLLPYDSPPGGHMFWSHILLSYCHCLGRGGGRVLHPQSEDLRSSPPSCPTRKGSQMRLNSEVWNQTVDANSTQQRQCSLYRERWVWTHSIQKGAVGT